jgi:hypothetical protein
MIFAQAAQLSQMIFAQAAQLSQMIFAQAAHPPWSGTNTTSSSSVPAVQDCAP